MEEGRSKKLLASVARPALGSVADGSDRPAGAGAPSVPVRALFAVFGATTISTVPDPTPDGALVMETHDTFADAVHPQPAVGVTDAVISVPVAGTSPEVVGETVAALHVAAAFVPDVVGALTTGFVVAGADETGAAALAVVEIVPAALTPGHDHTSPIPKNIPIHFGMYKVPPHGLNI